VGNVKKVVRNTCHTVSDNTDNINKNRSRIKDLEQDEKPVNHIFHSNNQPTDYSIDGMFRSIGKVMHHWFIFYITAGAILASIIIPLLVLALIGHVVG
jgi:hypothetical protein